MFQAHASRMWNEIRGNLLTLSGCSLCGTFAPAVGPHKKCQWRGIDRATGPAEHPSRAGLIIACIAEGGGAF
jgi:hypothetical protein